MSNSNSNSNNNSNPADSTNNSSAASRSHTYHRHPPTHLNPVIGTQSYPQPPELRLDTRMVQQRLPSSDVYGVDAALDTSRPSTPTFVYIVTSQFTSQTLFDGIRLSESDIIGFQILAVFARLEDANSYAENECEEIDAGVRRRRIRRIRGDSLRPQEGDGIRTETVRRSDGTVSWVVEDLGQIEVARWTVQ